MDKQKKEVKTMLRYVKRDDGQLEAHEFVSIQFNVSLREFAQAVIWNADRKTYEKFKTYTYGKFLKTLKQNLMLGGYDLFERDVLEFSDFSIDELKQLEKWIQSTSKKGCLGLTQEEIKKIV